jgi:glucosamine--fructose-6-phosphate aminotransferase (isomerizing)
LVEPTQYLQAAGATTVAFVNDTASPLAASTQWLLPLHAGPEYSVAATKSFIHQLVAGARVVAVWEGDSALRNALQGLPEALQQALACDWTAALPVLEHADRLYVIGRGTGLAVAAEMALKFKETCGIQAEAFSGAELRHGPMALVGPGYPVLVLAPPGPAQAGLLALAAELKGRGAAVLLAAPSSKTGTTGIDLALAAAPHEALAAITAVQSFYPMVEALARRRGLDPDAPAHLSKVTLTR